MIKKQMMWKRLQGKIGLGMRTRLQKESGREAHRETQTTEIQTEKDAKERKNKIVEKVLMRYCKRCGKWIKREKIVRSAGLSNDLAGWLNEIPLPRELDRFLYSH